MFVFWGKGLAHGFWHKQTHGDSLVSSTNISREEGLKLTYELMPTMCDPSWTCVWLHNFTLGIFTNHVDILQGWAHSDSNSYSVVILTQRVSKLYGDFWLSSPARSRAPQKLCADPTKKKLCILFFSLYRLHPTMCSSDVCGILRIWILFTTMCRFWSYQFISQWACPKLGNPIFQPQNFLDATYFRPILV